MGNNGKKNGFTMQTWKTWEKQNAELWKGEGHGNIFSVELLQILSSWSLRNIEFVKCSIALAQITRHNQSTTICMSVWMSVCMSVWFCLSVCMHACMHIYTYAFPSVFGSNPIVGVAFNSSSTKPALGTPVYYSWFIASMTSNNYGQWEIYHDLMIVGIAKHIQ